MMFIIYLIPYFILAIGGLVTYLIVKKAEKNKLGKAVSSVIITLIVFSLYNAAQPAYMPKGTVGTMKPVPYAQVDNDVVIVDNMLKPKMNDEEREEHFKENVDIFKSEVEKILSE